MIAGVVYDPIRQEMFTAERGSGAYLNNRRIHVSAVQRLEDSLVCTGFPSRKRHLNINMHFYHQLGDGHSRRAPLRIRGDRPGLCRLRPARRLLGVRPESVGHGGRRACWRRKPGAACRT